MNKVKKIFVLVLIAVTVSLFVTGCNDKNEHPTGDLPSKEILSEEHPTEEAASEEHPANKEHPKK